MRHGFQACLSVLAVAVAFSTVGALPPGSPVRWANSGTTNPCLSTVSAPICESNFAFYIPPSDDLPANTIVRVEEIRLASVHERFSNDLHSRCCDPDFLCLNSVSSDHAQFLGPDTVRSGAGTRDHALAYRFTRPCDIKVGHVYGAAVGNSVSDGLAFVWQNGKLVFGYSVDRGTCRYVKSGGSSGGGIVTSTVCPGYEPVCEICGTVVDHPVDASRDITVGAVRSLQLSGREYVRDLTLNGSGVLRTVGGSLAVEGTLTVNGNVEAAAEALDLSMATVRVAKGASFTYRVSRPRQTLRAVYGPGRFVKEGGGELWVVNGTGRLPRLLDGDLSIDVESGCVRVDGGGAEAAFGDVRIVLREDSALGCRTRADFGGRTVIRYDGNKTKNVFSAEERGPVRLGGTGSLALTGAGPLAIDAEWAAEGTLTVATSVLFLHPVVRAPARLDGTGRVMFATDGFEHDAEDGWLAHRMTFDGYVADLGANPYWFFGAVEDDVRFEATSILRAYLLTTEEPASVFFSEDKAFEPGDFTVLLRAKTEATRNAVLAAFGSARGHGLVLRTDEEGQVELSAWRHGLVDAHTPAAEVIDPTGAYHTYALVYVAAARRVTLVADGTAVGSVPCDASALEGLWFGGTDLGPSSAKARQATAMYVGEFRVYRKALSPGRTAAVFDPAAAAPFFCKFVSFVSTYRREVATLVLAVALVLLVFLVRAATISKNLRAQRLFFSIASHDIRTPLNAIVGFAELMDERPDDVETRLRQASFIVEGGKTLARLVDDVLDLAKLESGKMTMRPEPTDIAQLVADVLAACEKARAEKGLAFVPKLGGMPPLLVDPRRLRQILFNLVENACRFTDAGQVGVTAAWSRRRLVLAVSDTGRGIPPADHKRIFRPFVQGKDRNHRDGTGLGLAVCNGLAKAMGGKLGVVSKVGAGSTFTLEIPARAAKGVVPEAKAPDPERCAGAPETERRHILVVDDSAVNRAVLTAMLRHCGEADVREAKDGRAALEALKAHPETGLVLTDLRMPGMDGAALVRAIRADATLVKLPVYLISGDDDATRTAAAAGFTGTLRKPVSRESLQALLEKL